MPSTSLQTTNNLMVAALHRRIQADAIEKAKQAEAWARQYLPDATNQQFVLLVAGYLAGRQRDREDETEELFR